MIHCRQHGGSLGPYRESDTILNDRRIVPETEKEAKMSISGIGSVNSYIYNMKTGKLSAKDGKEDEFVDYFNDELDGKDSAALNGFDQQRKGSVKQMLHLMEEGMFGKNVLEKLQGDEIEITSETLDATTSVYYVNGEKVFTANAAVEYTQEEINIFGTITQPYKTTHPTGYDPLKNRLSIGVGDTFEFGNRYRFTVESDRVRVDSYGNGTAKDYENAGAFAFGLSALIHFGDQQAFSALHRAAISTSMMLEFLKDLGVDTDREFMINDTVCEVRNGRIGEVGNKVGVPSSIHQKAVGRYEELLYIPLSER